MIVENEQNGQERAEYGRAVLKKLSAHLTKKFGKGGLWKISIGCAFLQNLLTDFVNSVDGIQSKLVALSVPDVH